jgi:hypothetical protein
VICLWSRFTFHASRKVAVTYLDLSWYGPGKRLEPFIHRRFA